MGQAKRLMERLTNKDLRTKIIELIWQQEHIRHKYSYLIHPMFDEHIVQYKLDEYNAATSQELAYLTVLSYIDGRDYTALKREGMALEGVLDGTT